MNDQPEVTVDSLNAAIRKAFEHIYTNITADAIDITHNDDETIDVNVPDGPTFRADIYSDDDGFLRFRPYDEDYEAEFPDEDPYEFLMIRVKAY